MKRRIATGFELAMHRTDVLGASGMIAKALASLAPVEPIVTESGPTAAELLRIV